MGGTGVLGALAIFNGSNSITPTFGISAVAGTASVAAVSDSSGTLNAWVTPPVPKSYAQTILGRQFTTSIATSFDNSNSWVTGGGTNNAHSFQTSTADIDAVVYVQMDMPTAPATSTGSCEVRIIRNSDSSQLSAGYAYVGHTGATRYEYGSVAMQGFDAISASATIVYYAQIASRGAGVSCRINGGSLRVVSYGALD